MPNEKRNVVALTGEMFYQASYKMGGSIFKARKLSSYFRIGFIVPLDERYTKQLLDI